MSHAYCERLQLFSLWVVVDERKGLLELKQDALGVACTAVGRREAQLLSTREIHALLEPYISEVLSPQGFENRSPLVWVRSHDAPIRQMFQLNLWKGATVAPSWGFSLDFVPHISGSTVKWHRTPKSARLDLRVDSRNPQSNMSFLWGPSGLLENAPLALRIAFRSSDQWWSSVSSIADLPLAFERLKEYYAAHRGLGFYNYSQHNLAYAFSLAKVGRVEEAEAELDLYPKSGNALGVKNRIRELLTQVVPL